MRRNIQRRRWTAWWRLIFRTGGGHFSTDPGSPDADMGGHHHHSRGHHRPGHHGRGHYGGGMSGGGHHGGGGHSVVGNLVSAPRSSASFIRRTCPHQCIASVEDCAQRMVRARLTTDREHRAPLVTVVARCHAIANRYRVWSMAGPRSRWLCSPGASKKIQQPKSRDVEPDSLFKDSWN